MSLVEKLFGSFSDRELKKVNPITKQVLALEPKYQAMSDADLQAQTAVFKQQLAEGKTLDDILPDAFAVCREAAWRVLGMKHFPVQVTGGIALHRGDIAEMQTGEGKTLVATLPAYLNALTGEGVHIVTVNDYLAKRDSEWMGKLYRWLGLTVGLIVQGMDGDARRAAYNADITYGTNNEFGFDYLRDNMVTYKANMVQRGHAYAIVDEVDSILIDEARTPLIISGRGEDSSSLYTQVDRFVRTLRKSVVVELEDKVSTDEQADGDYVVDEKHKTCTLTAAGIKKAEAYFKVENLAAAENMTLAHHIDQAIKAYGVMQRDIDYVVKDGQVIIVDEFTGRLMIGRRYNEGLHQAIEAKEGVKIAAESKTLATITFQNYFRMYKKLWYDRYCPHRSHRVYRDLRPEHRQCAHQPPGAAQGLPGRHLQDRGGQVPRCHRAGNGVPQERSACAGGYCQRGKERDPRQNVTAPYPGFQRAERQEPRARSRDRSAGR